MVHHQARHGGEGLQQDQDHHSHAQLEVVEAVVDGPAQQQKIEPAGLDLLWAGTGVLFKFVLLHFQRVSTINLFFKTQQTHRKLASAKIQAADTQVDKLPGGLWSAVTACECQSSSCRYVDDDLTVTMAVALIVVAA